MASVIAAWASPGTTEGAFVWGAMNRAPSAVAGKGAIIAPSQPAEVALHQQIVGDSAGRAGHRRQQVLREARGGHPLAPAPPEHGEQRGRRRCQP